MIQQADYEWRSPFCTTCNKVVHACKKKEHHPGRKQERIKQVWAPKIDNNNTAKPTENSKKGSISHGEIENVRDKENEDEEVAWTVMRSTNKHKGKEPRFEEPIIGSTNGFDALMIGEYSVTFDNKVPWCYDGMLGV